jgi:hypothetical protein
LSRETSCLVLFLACCGTFLLLLGLLARSGLPVLT